MPYLPPVNIFALVLACPRPEREGFLSILLLDRHFTCSAELNILKVVVASVGIHGRRKP